MKLILTTALSAGLALGATQARAAEDPAGSGISSDPQETQPSEQPSEPGVIHKHTEDVTIEPQQPAQPGTTETMPGETRPETELAPAVPEVQPTPSEQPSPYMTPAPTVVEEKKESKTTSSGFGIMAGGGIFGFADSAARSATTDIGASYTARVVGGLNMPLALELAYIGTAQNLNALGVERDAKLISNGGEAALRINLLPGTVTPYLLGGAAWKRYDVTNTNINVSNVRDNDNVVEFPVGGGLTWRYYHFLLDARGAYRFATDAELFRVGDVGLGNWEANLKAGAEF